jgi:putative peptidoglycan lipid II flippase
LAVQQSSRNGTKEASLAKNSALVAIGIFASRIAGLIRERAFAHYFGSSDVADVIRAALRIPNLLQNLFGEGSLSAAFIPVYVKLRDNQDSRKADDLASAVFCLLGLAMSCLVLLGVFATPLLIDLIAPGFSGSKRELAVTCVRILFPGVGLLTMSAWCLGILNSHRKFLISYTAPIAWNLAMIASLIGLGGSLDLVTLSKAFAWASVVGSALQFGIQLPQVARLLRTFKIHLGTGLQSVRTVVKNFVPAMVSRGVVQISAYVDTLIASFLPTGALAGLGYAQMLYTLPVSLFGMSVSAAELPTLSSSSAENDEAKAFLRTRLNNGLRQIAFLVVPSAMAFFALGDVIAAALYQTGRFTHGDALYVWAILAGSSIGLLSNTMGRLYQSVHYALQDTRTPFYFAGIRVAFSAILGYVAAIHGPAIMGIDQRWGVAGLTGASGISAWIEYSLLKRSLKSRIGRTGLEASFLAKLWIAAGAGAVCALAMKTMVTHYHPLISAIAVLGVYGIIYFIAAFALRIPEVKKLLNRIAKRR